MHVTDVPVPASISKYFNVTTEDEIREMSDELSNAEDLPRESILREGGVRSKSSVHDVSSSSGDETVKGDATIDLSIIPKTPRQRSIKDYIEPNKATSTPIENDRVRNESKLDLDEDDEVYIVQCPQEVEPGCLVNAVLDLSEGPGHVTVSDESTIDFLLMKADSSLALAVNSSNHEMEIRHIKTKGTIILTKHVDLPEIEIDKVDVGVVPYPENLRAKNPLDLSQWGYSYPEKSRKRKKKRKKRSGEFVSDGTVEFNQEETYGELIANCTLTKKKSKVKTESICETANGGIDMTLEVTSDYLTDGNVEHKERKKKKKKKSLESLNFQ